MRQMQTEAVTVKTRLLRVRWLIGGVILLNSLLQFVDRANISVVIPQISREMGLSHSQAGLAMSAFFLGYVLTQVAGGWLLRAVGTRTAVFLGTITYSLFTHLTGQARGFGQLVACRFGLGLGEGPILVGLTTAVNDWFPLREKARASFLVYAAGSMAMIFVPPLIATFSLEIGWRMIFTLFALPGYLLAVVWFLVVRTKPEEHPWMTTGEVQEIRQGQRETRSESSQTSAVKQFLSLTFLGITAAYALNAFFFFGLMAWIPSYLLSLGFTQNQMGWLTSLYWLGTLFGTALGSYLSDVVFGGRRRPPILLSNAIGAILQVLWLFFLQGYLGLVPVYLVAIGFCLSLGLACYAPLVMGASSAAHFPVLMGFVATFGAVGGFLGPLTVGRLYDLFQSYTPGFGVFILSNVLIIVVVGLLRERRMDHAEGR
jgi:MFS family permease